jgi:hypothetical protein
LTTKKVIYIAYAHLSEKVARDSYIDHLRANGVVVEYWDLIALLFGGFGEANATEADYIFTPETYDDLEERLRLPENRNAIYVVLIVYEGRFVRLFQLLTKYNCRMFFILWAQFPSRKTALLQKIFGRLADPLRLGTEILNRIKGIAYKNLKLVKPFDVVFAAGDAAIRMYPDAAKVIPVNFVDYDHYMRAKSESQRIVKGPYAVFLDIYLPYQSDLKVIGLQTVEPDRYFFLLNRFFKIIEQKYGVKVVIAAHPKADYGSKTFEGREHYRGLTPDLVKDAEFVISHHSASLGYAVLNSKPIIFIYTNAMKLLYKNTTTMILLDKVAAYLNANIYNIDEVTEGYQIALGSVSPERYESYKYNYLTTRESEHTTTQEIFWNEINRE